jgi:hypothetical protein
VALPTHKIVLLILTWYLLNFLGYCGTSGLTMHCMRSWRLKNQREQGRFTGKKYIYAFAVVIFNVYCSSVVSFHCILHVGEKGIKRHPEMSS